MLYFINWLFPLLIPISVSPIQTFGALYYHEVLSNVLLCSQSYLFGKITLLFVKQESQNSGKQIFSLNLFFMQNKILKSRLVLTASNILYTIKLRLERIYIQIISFLVGLACSSNRELVSSLLSCKQMYFISIFTYCKFSTRCY